MKKCSVLFFTLLAVLSSPAMACGGDKDDGDSGKDGLRATQGVTTIYCDGDGGKDDSGNKGS